jgi:TPR repeat protein
MGVPADIVEGYVWTKLAADQGFAKAISNLSEMSAALTNEDRKQADKRVARFQPKGNEGVQPNFAGKRSTRPTSATLR